MAEQGHTKLPWVVVEGREGTVWIVPRGERMPVAECPKEHGESYATIYALRDERLANAAFIVRACNSHEELVEALYAAVRCIASGPTDDAFAEATLDKLQAALSTAAPAGGGSDG